MDFPDYYRTLQVHPDADIEVIRAAYRRLSKKYHPDLNHSINTHETMALINEAYKVLSNPLQRAKYDNLLKSQRDHTTGVAFDTKKVAAELALYRLKKEILSLRANIEEIQKQMTSLQNKKQALSAPALSVSFIAAFTLVLFVVLILSYATISEDSLVAGSGLVVSLILIGYMVNQRSKDVATHKLKISKNLDRQLNEYDILVRHKQSLLKEKLEEYKANKAFLKAL